jgi:hypothetical protein
MPTSDEPTEYPSSSMNAWLLNSVGCVGSAMPRLRLEHWLSTMTTEQARSEDCCVIDATLSFDPTSLQNGSDVLRSTLTVLIAHS